MGSFALFTRVSHQQEKSTVTHAASWHEKPTIE